MSDEKMTWMDEITERQRPHLAELAGDVVIGNVDDEARRVPAVKGNCAGCGKPWVEHEVPLTGVHLRAYERLGFDGKERP